MGRKKGYNWKARQNVDTVIDDRPTKKIKLDLEVEGKYDESNALVLPSKKRKTKVKNKSEKVTRILTNKQRKKLEKVVEKKQKKLARAGLLDELSKVQATPAALKQLTSITTVQTKGLRKINAEEKVMKNENNESKKVVKLNSLKGARLQLLRREIKIDSSDPNVLGFESSGDSSSQDESEEEQDDDEITNEKIIDMVEIPVENKKIDCQKKEENKVIIKIDSSELKNNDKKISVTQNKEGDNGKNNRIRMPIVKKPTEYVEVDRTSEIQKARLKLPILAEEQEIMEIINENSVVIIAGETGSGKTTQVPQFLYEAGYAKNKMIGITEPRRIAAISMSKRVAEEMNLSSDEVSYLIRFAGNVTEDTKLKFMTDGVLFRELKDDLLLTKYSVIIVDEAHERSVYTDVLIGMLSRIVAYRQKDNSLKKKNNPLKKHNPLKLIIMSATLRLQDFTENKRLFKIPPPVINVESRQFPVTNHFNKSTNENYLKEALKKTIDVHTKLPEGGILVFVTGQKEVMSLVDQLRKKFPFKGKKKLLEAEKAEDEESSEDEETFDQRLDKVSKRRKKKVKILPKVNLDDYIIKDDDEENNSDMEGALSDNEDLDITIPVQAEPLWVLPLFSMLPSDAQARVFKPPPTGCRLCIVSTNVAETSVTIPNIKYVIDTGKTKEKIYDKITGVSTYVISWTSKASAEQRAGRAGRMGPGHCYRLYSSAVYNDEFKEFSLPEIQSRPIDDLYIQMKCMNLDKIHNFPFPTPPDSKQLEAAESRLECLELLENSKITPMGREAAKYPVLPRFGKMLSLSRQYDLLPYVICLVAALSVQEVLLETPLGNKDVANTRNKWTAQRRRWAGTGNFLLLGDAMTLIRAVGGAEFANCQGKLEAFCKDTGLRVKAVLEIRKLRIQLTNEIIKNLPGIDVVVDPKLPPPSELQAKLLRQILLLGLGDKVAKKIDVREINDFQERKKLQYAYQANDMEEPVYMDRRSVLINELPEFVVYQEIYETNKIYIRGITAIEPEWLPVYVSRLCQLGPPLSDPVPWFDESSGTVKCMVSGTFGRQAWPLPFSPIVYPESLDAYKWFAKFFLLGKVFKKLEKYEDQLLASTDAITRPWGKLQPRIMTILNALTSKRCCSRESVENLWKTNPKFLLEEYLMWITDDLHGTISLSWPPINN